MNNVNNVNDVNDKSKNDPLKPELALLIKLGSIAVHADEMFSPSGHQFDKITLNNLLQDPELKAWLQEMDARGLLPVKRA